MLPVPMTIIMGSIGGGGSIIGVVVDVVVVIGIRYTPNQAVKAVIPPLSCKDATIHPYR
jgi:hypothetical protein